MPNSGVMVAPDERPDEAVDTAAAELPTLTRDDIFSASDIKTKRVPVPEWGGAVVLHGLTDDQVTSYQNSAQRARDHKDNIDMRGLRAKLLVKSIFGEDGRPVFTESDAPKLGAKSHEVMDRLFDVVRALSGLTKESVEELEKN